MNEFRDFLYSALAFLGTLFGFYLIGAWVSGTIDHMQWTTAGRFFLILLGLPCAVAMALFVLTLNHQHGHRDWRKPDGL